MTRAHLLFRYGAPRRTTSLTDDGIGTTRRRFCDTSARMTSQTPQAVADYLGTLFPGSKLAYAREGDGRGWRYDVSDTRARRLGTVIVSEEFLDDTLPENVSSRLRPLDIEGAVHATGPDRECIVTNCLPGQWTDAKPAWRIVLRNKGATKWGTLPQRVFNQGGVGQEPMLLASRTSCESWFESPAFDSRLRFGLWNAETDAVFLWDPYAAR